MGNHTRAVLVTSLALLFAACGQNGAPTPSGNTAAGPRPWAAYLKTGSGRVSAQDEALTELATRADWLANQPEMQEPEATQTLYANWQEPSFLAETEASYYEPESPVQPPNGDASTLLSVQSVQGRVSALMCVEGDDTCVPRPAPPERPPQDPTSTLSYIKGVAWSTVDNYNGQYNNRLVINTQYPTPIVWDRDGCSVPTWLALTYKSRFEPACNVHDFGYRNLALYEKNETNRKITDDNFLGNMRDICHHRPWYQRPFCRAAAWSYHAAVRTLGANYW